MQFINRTGHTHRLPEVGKNIPFLGEKPQEIDTDSILRSKKFQNLCLSGEFLIVEAGASRIEQNLLRLQKGAIPQNGDTQSKVLFKGNFSGYSGFSKANRNMLYGMVRNGLDVSILPSHPIGGIDAAEAAILKRLHKLPHPRSISIQSAIPTFAERSNHRYSILYTTTESKTIPQQFIQACDPFNEIWTVSDFCKEAFLTHGLKKPIYVIPNAVDNRTYNEGARAVPTRPPLKDFRFIHVASWNYRKGYDVLLKAYLSEFTSKEPVSLLVVNRYNVDENGNRLKMVDKEIKSFVDAAGLDHPHVARCGVDISENDMPGLYRYCHCMVMPTRGEGFGLPFLEASLCGLPVIGTRYSGQTMFLNDNNSYLLDIDKLGIATSTEVHYWDGQQFPEMKSEECISQLRKLMRNVYTNYKEAKQKNEILKAEATEKYSCDAVGLAAKERIVTIWNQLS